MPNPNYALGFLGRTVTVNVDRPLGTRHPEHWNIIYGVNYGHVNGVMAPDGEELDAYVLGVKEPLWKFTGDCIAVIRRLGEPDDKLVVVPPGSSISDEEIEENVHFQERFFPHRIVRKRIRI